MSRRGECPECQRKFLHNNNKNTFLQKAKEKHGNKYDYSLITEYKGNCYKIPIICPIHGVHMQTPSSHLNNYGCPKCGYIITGKKLAFSIDEYIEKANIVHHNKYDYSKSIYTNAGTKIEIICPDHGSFWQNPNHHLRGCECPKCNSCFSKMEKKWLDTLNIPESNRRVFLKINGRFIFADGYDKITNTIYEFNGDFWHGNPKVYNQTDINKASKKTFGELYTSTIERENFLKNNGYNVITMWEYDFKEFLKSNKLIQ